MQDDRDYPDMVQLATRIPKNLHRRVKVHCVHAETSVMAFVIDALSEHLQSGRKGRTRTASRQRQTA
jgi:hypothetical protein